jgi:hypothetical protein
MSSSMLATINDIVKLYVAHPWMGLKLEMQAHDMII